MLYIITSREHLLEWHMRTSTCFSVITSLKVPERKDLFFLCKMDGIRGKGSTNASKMNESPSNRKQGNVTEVASSGTCIDGSQPETLSRNKSKECHVVMRSHVARRWEDKLQTRLRPMTGRWLVSSWTRRKLPKFWTRRRHRIIPNP